MVRTLKICSLSNFQVLNTLLLTVVIILYHRATEFTPPKILHSLINILQCNLHSTSASEFKPSRFHKWDHVAFVFCVWLISLNMMSSRLLLIEFPFLKDLHLDLLVDTGWYLCYWEHTWYAVSFWYADLISSLFPFIVVLGGDTLWHLQRFLQCIKYIILEFTPFTVLLYPPTPPSWFLE
jgi:hypothetical protein